MREMVWKFKENTDRAVPGNHTMVAHLDLSHSRATYAFFATVVTQKKLFESNYLPGFLICEKISTKNELQTLPCSSLVRTAQARYSIKVPHPRLGKPPHTALLPIAFCSYTCPFQHDASTTKLHFNGNMAW